MTSITATQSHQTMMSPRERLQKELESEISSGTIAASDETALTAALDAIDEAMEASRPSGTGATRGAPPKPEEMQEKIESLIDQQVEDGTLTSEQADELKELFANAAPKGGPGGPGGAGGPPPPPPEGEEEEASSTTSASSSSKTDMAKLLEDFLKQLQEKKGSTTAYGTDGTSTSSGIMALVLDTTA